MRVLLTGGSGFLGAAVANCLKTQGFEVWSTSRHNNLNGLTHIYWDMENPDSIELSADAPSFQFIIHLACKVGWDGSTIQKMLVPNVIATSKIAQLARKQNAFLIFSSAAIVHGSKSEYINCRSPVSCDTPYAESKKMAEEEILRNAKKYCILRFGGIFGKNGPVHLGLNRAIADIMIGKNPEYSGSGSARRNYIYVNDAARVIASVCKRRLQGIHLCAGSSILSIRAMLEDSCSILSQNKCIPQRKEGNEAQDQIIESSPKVEKGLSFQEAIRDILL